MNNNQWDNHYTNDRSKLAYPDENLVRLLKKNYKDQETRSLIALDLGCGTGRHLKLLSECGFTNILGTDSSYNALLSSKTFPGFLINCDNRSISLKTDSIDLIVAWGSLHYSNKIEMSEMLDEIRFILKPGGLFLATIRSSRDTHLKRGEDKGNNEWVTNLDDISGSRASFYSEDELKQELSIFSQFEYGIIERSIIGDMTKLISHWVISARK